MAANQGMSWDQVVTLGLAGYGALLSSALALREWLNGRRRVSIRLEFVHFLEMAQLTVTNVGYRPITITGIAMQPKGHDVVPRHVLAVRAGRANETAARNPKRWRLCHAATIRLCEQRSHIERD